MDIQTISAIVFIVAMTVFLIVMRKKVVLQKIFFPLLYLILYRSKFGLRFMKNFPARHPNIVKWFGHIGVVVGFIGMVFISINLVMVFSTMITTPDAPSGVAPVLPVPVRGAIYVPFFYWIISIFVIATVHEFAHGIVANHYKIPIKSSGFAFFGLVLPIIPAAFVEPNENVLKRKSAWKQLSVFAAGPFSNIVLAFIVLGVIVAVMNPLSALAFANDGVMIDSVFVNSSAAEYGISSGEIIMSVDGVDIFTVDDFTRSLQNLSSGSYLYITTNSSSYNVVLGEHPENSDRGFLGVTVSQHVAENQDFIDRYGIVALEVVRWISGLFFWLFLLNLGIGLFNLVPLGIVDGGMMLQIALLGVFKGRKELAHKIWKFVSLGFLFLILFMLIMSFL